MRLEGKAALVTGSSRGIGVAIIERLAEEGADVVLDYNRTVDEAKEVAARIQRRGRKAVALQADVSTADGARKLVREARNALGRLDILVNNAGVERRADFVDVTEADYDLVMNVNLRGPFFGSQEFVRILSEDRRGGKIINISSVHEELPFPHFASYCASKGAIRMLTRTLAVELRGRGITVNAIAPGAIRTPINDSLLHDKAKLDALVAKIPLGRMGEPSDVAGVAAFLASKDGDYVTGATYFVDGGLTWNYEEQ